MSDEWYYEDRRASVGPVTRAEILAVIAASKDDDLLVWREGFQDWKKANDVPELSVKRPPPLPPLPIALAPEDPAKKAGKIETLKGCLQPVGRAPALRRINGIGCTLLGGFTDSDLRPMFFSLYAFTFLWIPLIPIQIYLVSGSDLYRFHGSISFKDFGRVYPGQTSKLLGSAFLHSLMMLVVVVCAVFLIAILRYTFRGYR